MNFDQFINTHRSLQPTDDLRLGQRFVNNYIRHPWPQLFYQNDEQVAMRLIKEYLVQHQYWPDTPTILPERTGRSNG